jgi:O-antigen ligase
MAANGLAPALAPLAAGTSNRARSSIGIAIAATVVAMGEAYAASRWPLVSVAGLVAVIGAAVALARPNFALLALAAAMPWEDMLAYPTSFLTIVKALGLLLMAAAFLALLRGATSFRVALVPALCVLVLLMSVALSLAVSGDPSTGVLKSSSFVALALLFFVRVRFLDSWERLIRFVSVLAVSAAAAAVFGLVRFLSGSVALASGPIGNPNDFAFLLAAFLPFHIELAIRQPRFRPFWVLTFAVSVAAIIATLSRGGLVGVGVAGVWLVVTGRVSVTGVVATVLIAAAVVGVGFVFASHTFSQPFQHKQSFGAKTVSARETYWQAALQIGMNHPIAGIGPNRFRTVAGRYIHNDPVPISGGAVVHNSYLELFAEDGAIAVGAFIALLIATWSAMSRTERQARSRRDPDATRFVSAVKAGLLIAVVSGSFISVQLHTPFWVLCAIACAVSLQETPVAT